MLANDTRHEVVNALVANIRSLVKRRIVQAKSAARTEASWLTREDVRGGHVTPREREYHQKVMSEFRRAFNVLEAEENELWLSLGQCLRECDIAQA